MRKQLQGKEKVEEAAVKESAAAGCPQVKRGRKFFLVLSANFIIARGGLWRFRVSPSSR
jgi:hypothetical protein